MAKKVKAKEYSIISAGATEKELGKANGYSKNEALWSYLRNEGLSDDAIWGVVKSQRYNGEAIVAREVK